ncbi:MAG: hypothetical protein KGV44_11520 [Flavobacteriaceae bacterium]|nr:hypothetical protein [Flavobacteriaceae bacterium]
MATQQNKKYVSIDQLASQIGKVPPQALEVEEAVLGALLLEQNAVVTVGDILKAESFYKEQHQTIYRAIESTKAVFPIAGRAAKIIKSLFCQPAVILSNSVNPDGTPLNPSSCSDNCPIISKASLIIGFIGFVSDFIFPDAISKTSC